MSSTIDRITTQITQADTWTLIEDASERPGVIEHLRGTVWHQGAASATIELTVVGANSNTTAQRNLNRDAPIIGVRPNESVSVGADPAILLKEGDKLYMRSSQVPATVHIGATLEFAGKDLPDLKYEEGVWFPSLEGSNAAGAASYNIQSGSWGRVGNLVTVFGRLRVNLTGATGPLRVGGLPFPIRSGGAHATGMSVAFFSGLASNSDSVSIFGYGLAGTDGILLYESSAGNSGGLFSMSQADLSSSFQIYFSMTYLREDS